MKKCVVVSAPSVEPVSLEEIKTHLRLSGSEEEALLSSLIASARLWVELETGRALISQTLRVFLERRDFKNAPRDWVRWRNCDSVCVSLPRAPLQSVSQILAYDDDDMAALWDCSNYYVDTASEPGRVYLRNKAVWPSATRASNALQIDYVAGYGDAPSDVPQTLRTCILHLAAFWFEHRGDESGIEAVPLSVTALLLPFRLVHVGGGL